MSGYRLTILGKAVLIVFVVIFVYSISTLVGATKIGSENIGGSLGSQDGSLVMAAEAVSIIEEPILKVPVEEAYSYGENKVAFLTFDDGPTPSITPQILDILEQYNVKATFCVIGYLVKENPEILRDIAAFDHAIGIHTYSHRYKQIYSSSSYFLEEVEKSQELLKEVLGQDFFTRIVRFPGGSFSVPDVFKEVLKDKGYVYVDWNTISGDGESNTMPAEKQLERLKDTARGKKNLIILLHDSVTKQETVKALPGIIEYLQEQGYQFALLK